MGKSLNYDTVRFSSWADPYRAKCRKIFMDHLIKNKRLSAMPSEINRELELGLSINVIHGMINKLKDNGLMFEFNGRYYPLVEAMI